MTIAALRRVTAADVAREAGVSRATVGFVLNGTKGQTISVATAKRVREAASKLGYTPHSQAQALRSGRSKIVLMVLPDWPLEHQMRVHLEHVARVLDDAGLTLVTHTRRPHADEAGQPIWAAIDPLAVVGLELFSEAEIASMHRLNITNIVPSPDQQAELASRDDEVFDTLVAHRLQVRHLLERGHRRLGFAMPADQRLRELANGRHQAVIEVCAAEGLMEPVLITSVATDGDRSEYDVEKFIREGLTAVIAYNDNVAADIIGSATTQGIHVPTDLAVIGHDDSPLAARFIPSISSIRVDHRLLGEYVGNLVLKSIGQGQDAPFPHVRIDVIPRTSTEVNRLSDTQP
ncbi:LacI family DNA-binding transcriptional regulator [Arthrobacter ruber]|uniref:LacI family DNA-binding transcriptional regulator n=1 Tax=Arthrobacter ruber TaxID=1258893 RepID=UPI000CF429CA|nr:LacI family DNA-binding transcriptional regulator [Arthrobacter ruber]